MLEEFKRALQQKKLPSPFLLFGENTHLQQEILVLLESAFLTPDTKDFNFDSLDAESQELSELISIPRTLPLQGGHRLVVIKNVSSLNAFTQKTLIESWGDLPESTFLYLAWNEPVTREDAKKPIPTWAEKKGWIMRLWKPNAMDGKRFCQETARSSGKELTPEAADFLVEEVGSDYSLLRGEIEMLCLWAQGKSRIALEDVMEATGFQRAHSPYELFQKLRERKLSEALRVLPLVLEEMDPPMILFRMLHRTIREWLSARTNPGLATIPATQMWSLFHVSSKDTGAFVRDIQRFQEDELERCLHLIARYEEACKTGREEPAVALSQIVLAVCGRSGEALYAAG